MKQAVLQSTGSTDVLVTKCKPQHTLSWSAIMSLMYVGCWHVFVRSPETMFAHLRLLTFVKMAKMRSANVPCHS